MSGKPWTTIFFSLEKQCERVLPSVHLGRDAAWDDLEDLTAEQDEQFVHGVRQLRLNVSVRKQTHTSVINTLGLVDTNPFRKP